jgi:hypothetical protein
VIAWSATFSVESEGRGASGPIPGPPARNSMSENPEPRPNNYRRRVIGILVCLAPLAVPIASLAAGLAWNRAENFSGILIVIPAALLSKLNFYSSFLRGWLYHRKHGTLDRYQHESGIPVVGSLLLVVGSVFGFGAIGTALLGIIAVALDTAGLPWFLFATWQDSSLWD